MGKTRHERRGTLILIAHACPHVCRQRGARRQAPLVGCRTISPAK
jgi:hypothetical protein